MLIPRIMPAKVDHLIGIITETSPQLWRRCSAPPRWMGVPAFGR